MVPVVWLCPRVLRVVGSIRGPCVNAACPLHHLSFTGFQAFLGPPLPLHMYFPFHSNLLYHSFILYLASSDESFYPLTEFTHSHSLTSPCTFAFSGLCKPTRPSSHLHFSFSALQFPPPLPICASISPLPLCLSISIHLPLFSPSSL